MKKDSCIICQIVEGKIPSYRILENEKAVAILDINGATPGHCFIIPKMHYPIMEQVPDEDLAAMFSMANRISVAIFDHLGAEGTNIFVANGIPAGQTVAHFMINIIPRKQGDGVNLQWQPRQMDEEEISTIELKLKDELKGGAVSKATPKAAKKSAEKPARHAWENDSEEMLQQLRRIP